MRTRRSPKAQERLYKAIGRDLAREATLPVNAERFAGMVNALRLCLLEIEQAHRHHYPECDGFCPAHEAMAAARKALAP